MQYISALHTHLSWLYLFENPASTEKYQLICQKCNQLLRAHTHHTQRTDVCIRSSGHPATQPPRTHPQTPQKRVPGTGTWNGSTPDPTGLSSAPSSSADALPTPRPKPASLIGQTAAPAQLRPSAGQPLHPLLHPLLGRPGYSLQPGPNPAINGPDRSRTGRHRASGQPAARAQHDGRLGPPRPGRSTSPAIQNSSSDSPA